KTFDVGGGNLLLNSSDAGILCVMAGQAGVFDRVALQIGAGPVQLAGQPGTVALFTRLRAKLDEVATAHADAPENLLEDAVLSILRVTPFFVRTQIAGTPVVAAIR